MGRTERHYPQRKSLIREHFSQLRQVRHNKGQNYFMKYEPNSGKPITTGAIITGK